MEDSLDRKDFSMPHDFAWASLISSNIRFVYVSYTYTIRLLYICYTSSICLLYVLFIFVLMSYVLYKFVILPA